mgnify:CR=1 FL=1
MTDTAATRPYGVLGRVLGHSYTPTIYKDCLLYTSDAADE